MDVVCLGEALIDMVSLESGVGVAESSGFLKAPGGAPANVAAAVAKLGGSSAFLGKVGDDPFGHFLCDTFSQAGVNISGMRFDPYVRTGLAFVSLQQNGERDFCFFRNPSADMLYQPNEVDSDLIRKGRIFHFGSITMIEEPSKSATLAAIEIARDSGAILSFDPNLRLPLWKGEDVARKTIMEALPLTDILKISDEELLFLTGVNDETRGVKHLRQHTPNIQLIVVTKGRSGCYWEASDSLRGYVDGYQVLSVDTTGAGDGFVGGMLIELLHAIDIHGGFANLSHGDFERIFGYANRVGALTTTRKGAITSLPNHEDVMVLTH